MRIAICDGSAADRAALVKLLQTVGCSETLEQFASGEAFLEAAGQPSAFDLVFLETSLPDRSGMEVAWTLRQQAPETRVVFVTADRSLAVEAFAVHALHYLVKPLTEENIRETCSRMALCVTRHRPWLSLAVERGRHTVFFDEIVYLQCENHAVELFLTCGRHMRVWQPLAEFEEQLGGGFLRLNRGTLVNMDHIQKIDVDICVLQDGTRLELTSRRSATIRKKYAAYLHSALAVCTRLGQKGSGGRGAALRE